MSAPLLRPMGAGLELYGLRHDGTEFLIEISLSPVETDSGMLVSRAIRDITERKQAQEGILSLLDPAPDATVVVGADGRIVLVNTRTEKLFGYERAELLGQPVEVLVPERFWADHRKHRGKYMEHTQIRAMGAGLELFGLRKDATEFPVEISLSPQQTENGILVSSTIRDITQRGHGWNFAFLSKLFSLPVLARKVRSILDADQPNLGAEALLSPGNQK